jgi:hypothetical protein
MRFEIWDNYMQNPVPALRSTKPPFGVGGLRVAAVARAALRYDALSAGPPKSTFEIDWIVPQASTPGGPSATSSSGVRGSADDSDDGPRAFNFTPPPAPSQTGQPIASIAPPAQGPIKNNDPIDEQWNADDAVGYFALPQGVPGPLSPHGKAAFVELGISWLPVASFRSTRSRANLSEVGRYQSDVCQCDLRDRKAFA